MKNYFRLAALLSGFPFARAHSLLFSRISLRPTLWIPIAIFIIGLVAPLAASFGQSISPQTLNVGGSKPAVSGFSLDYSIGESASISTYKLSDNFTVSAGVLQSFTPLLVTGIANFNFTEGENITVSPNPATANIRIKGLLNHPGFIEFHLVDVNGSVLFIDPKSFYINYFEKEFNISALYEGVHFIRLMYQSMKGDTKSAIFKFIKIH